MVSVQPSTAPSSTAELSPAHQELVVQNLPNPKAHFIQILKKCNRMLVEFLLLLYLADHKNLVN